MISIVNYFGKLSVFLLIKNVSGVGGLVGCREVYRLLLFNG